MVVVHGIVLCETANTCYVTWQDPSRIDNIALSAYDTAEADEEGSSDNNGEQEQSCKVLWLVFYTDISYDEIGAVI